MQVTSCNSLIGRTHVCAPAETLLTSFSRENKLPLTEGNSTGRKIKSYFSEKRATASPISFPAPGAVDVFSQSGPQRLVGRKKPRSLPFSVAAVTGSPPHGWTLPGVTNWRPSLSPTRTDACDGGHQPCSCSAHLSWTVTAQKASASQQQPQ